VQDRRAKSLRVVVFSAGADVGINPDLNLVESSAIAARQKQRARSRSDFIWTKLESDFTL
jgi:hypothetical protein